MEQAHAIFEEREQRLDEIVTAYLKAIEQGQTPDRREWLERYPDLAAELEEFFDEQDRLEQLATPLRDDLVLADRENIETTKLPDLLGDFRIVREIGRGGMGIVYEAEQVSLRRRVALKVLPFAATMDSRQLQRFRNETLAAASLHHGNIVPVYFVCCERGVHFYAMQLIAGCSLAAVLREVRGESGKLPPVEAQPAGAVAGEEALTVEHQRGASGSAETVGLGGLSTQGPKRSREYFRSVARLGMQVAEALDYAHERGVIHRDVKPANILVDEQGLPWLTDFGLAHLQQSEGSLTMTGDLVGTLRYMSPEQALAKRVGIDHRTDVYSLGATLYEVLTLRPACPGGDRQEVLRQVAFEEPVAPRKLVRAVPEELETIVLKAMEKNPADRYATAQELADDLRRFLKDQPIKARRPSLRQVAMKWARRHRAAVRAVTAVLLVLAVVGGANGLWWLQKRAVAQEAARAGLDETFTWQEEEKWHEALSAVRRAKGLLAGVGADPHLLSQVEEREKDLEMALRLQEARLRLTALSRSEGFDTEAALAACADAFQWYGLDVERIDPKQAAAFLQPRSIPLQLAEALDFVATLRFRRNDPGWRNLLEVSRVIDPDPWRNRLREGLIAKDPRVGEELAASAQSDKLSPRTAILLAWMTQGTPAAERALSVLLRVRKRYPGDFWVNHDLGLHLFRLKPPRVTEAIRYHTAAVALDPRSPGAHLNLAIVLQRKGLLEEAIAEYREALRLKKDYAGAHSMLGTALWARGLVDEGITECRIAIKLDNASSAAHARLGFALWAAGKREEAMAAFQQAIRLDRQNAKALDNLGVALREQGRLAEAIAHHRLALSIEKDLPSAHFNLGIALLDRGLMDDAMAALQKVIRLRPDYAPGHNALGMALEARGKVQQAIACYHKAIALDPKLAEAHSNLGTALSGKGKVDEAIACYKKAIALDPKCAMAHFNLGNTLRARGKMEEAIVCFREATAINPSFARAHGALGKGLAEQGRFIEAQHALRRYVALRPDNHPQHRFASQMLRQCEQWLAADENLKAFLAGKHPSTDAASLLQMAILAHQPFNQLHVTAARLYRASFAGQPQLADSYRHFAAAAAARAGCGQGKDAIALGETERARWRQQALKWLRADLEAGRDRLVKDPERAGSILQKMRGWRDGADFTGMREPDALAKLPEAERQAWQKLWADVAHALSEAQGKASPAKKPDTK
jgi:tetratricopeptide (TPR) repeat protein